jgi:hypothetical protein
MRGSGIFAFSQSPATGQENKAGQVIRQRHLPVHQWIEQLAAAGFSEVVTETIDAPEPGKPGTMLVHARAA